MNLLRSCQEQRLVELNIGKTECERKQQLGNFTQKMIESKQTVFLLKNIRKLAYAISKVGTPCSGIWLHTVAYRKYGTFLN
jgi:hypothetical protein